MELSKFIGVDMNKLYNDSMLHYAILLFCRDLKIPVPKVIISTYDHPFRPISGTFSIIDYQITLFPYTMKSYKHHPFITVAHECRHAFQAYNKLLKFNPSSMENFWKGHLIDYNKLKYEELPWEIDAENYEKNVSRKLEIAY
jgi:hypothetical protein